MQRKVCSSPTLSPSLRLCNLSPSFEEKRFFYSTNIFFIIFFFILSRDFNLLITRRRSSNAFDRIVVNSFVIHPHLLLGCFNLIKNLKHL
ncbi:hypothetical protein AQUCO_00600017v1 [Aquilegia coerulea]|uniref:Uncharacterized protein n=1 Tax=Aquilegia coerulea TaxID=218851 RepID=A0A2G5EN69_AQUCA|nr:hypothetical protein AQUCO_00600017v1 [Aquilegia coerulea]